MQRTNNKVPILVTQIRQEMELNVIAYNHFLRDRVSIMSYATLLRNIHPLDRSTFAKQLHRKGILSEQGLAEFSEIY